MKTCFLDTEEYASLEAFTHQSTENTVKIDSFDFVESCKHIHMTPHIIMKYLPGIAELNENS